MMHFYYATKTIQIYSNRTLYKSFRMVLIILRHGESEWNKLNKFTGLIDIELSDGGKQEAISAGEILRGCRFDHIFSSNLARTIQTAEIIARVQNNNAAITQIPDFRERDYGDLTSKNKTELTEEFGSAQVTTWRRSFRESPPNGENLEQVTKRVGDAYQKHVQQLVSTGKNVLIVAHGNSLRALFVHLGIKNPVTIEKFEIGTAVPIQIDPVNMKFRYENAYELSSYQIIDSRGYPSLEVQCVDRRTKRVLGKGSTPSGASCGSTEVCELRDGDKDLYHGKSVFGAVDKISELNEHFVLSKKTMSNLSKCDEQFITLDGTEMKTKYGGNTSTALSFCMANTAANLMNQELYEYITDHYGVRKTDIDCNLPTPFVNIINGGKHGVTEDLKIQEFMIFAREDLSTSQQIRMYCEIYHTLKNLLVEKYGEQAKSIGDEGGFCPPIYSAEEALTIIEEAIEKSNYNVGKDVFIALDCAASEFYNTETKLYEIEKDKFVNSEELVDYYGDLIAKHPALKSIEDGFHESDYEAWKLFTCKFADKLMIVGDDLFTTNPKLIKQGLDEQWANTLLLKVNQIGTITEAIQGAKMMMNAGNEVIVSHRSGETNHAYIIDIAVGIGAKYVKIGSPCRGERVAKFNRLLEIEHRLLNLHA
jgi:enolase